MLRRPGLLLATLLAVGSEVSEALDCDQLRLLALYVACGWCGGLASALLSEANTIGASSARGAGPPTWIDNHQPTHYGARVLTHIFTRPPG